MSFLLDEYAARSCPVKTFNAFDERTTAKPLDENLQDLFQGGKDFQAEIFQHILQHHPDAVDLRLTPDADATVAAMRAAAPLILAGTLPADPVGHRRGRADLLVRVADGYRPVRIKPYRVVEKQTNATDLAHSTLREPARASVLFGMRYRVYRQGALLEVAHLWRMLEACGFAGTEPVGGVIGNDEVLSSDGMPGIAWVNLHHKFIRTFSRTAAVGHRLRSALQRYDHEHTFRVYVAETALSAEPTEPPVRPIRVRECESCAWWQVCRPKMHDDDISLRISKTPLDVRELQTLVSLGITTVDELARADIDAILPSYLPNTRHRDRAEQRLRQAARRARMLNDGVALERISSEPLDLPRAPVEIDLDIETSETDTTYLWGALVTDRRTGEQVYQHFSAFTHLTPDEEVELAAEFSRWLLEMVEREPEVLVYHYSDYEVVHLSRLAERSAHPDIVAATRLVPEHFVDLFRYVRDNFVAVEGLGLKTVAVQGAGFHWRDPTPGGLESQSWFNAAVADPDPATRDASRTRVLEYNEDDVRATWEVRRWMETTQPATN